MAHSRRQFLITLGAAGASCAAGGLLFKWLTTDDSPTATSGGLAVVKRTGNALGSEVSMIALHAERATADAALVAAFHELETVESVMSIYRPESQLSRLNRTGKLARAHPYLTQVLGHANALAARTGGAFDVTVQPLWSLYTDAKQQGRLPDDQSIVAARGRVGWQRMVVNDDRIELAPRMSVTLNGIAQGFASDRVLAALRRHGIEHALVNTGEVGGIGRTEDGAAWRVGIQHPREKDAFIKLTELSDRCIATSGDYETTFSDDHEHNHLFDPSTGRSPAHFQSVTVMARTGIEADALSTAVFVLGPERGLALVAGTPGADALLVPAAGGDLIKTDGFPVAS